MQNIFHIVIFITRYLFLLLKNQTITKLKQKFFPYKFTKCISAHQLACNFFKTQSSTVIPIQQVEIYPLLFVVDNEPISTFHLAIMHFKVYHRRMNLRKSSVHVNSISVDGEPIVDDSFMIFRYHQRAVFPFFTVDYILHLRLLFF